LESDGFYSKHPGLSFYIVALWMPYGLLYCESKVIYALQWVWMGNVQPSYSLCRKNVKWGWGWAGFVQFLVGVYVH